MARDSLREQGRSRNGATDGGYASRARGMTEAGAAARQQLYVVLAVRDGASTYMGVGRRQMHKGARIFTC